MTLFRNELSKCQIIVSGIVDELGNMDEARLLVIDDVKLNPAENSLFV